MTRRCRARLAVALAALPLLAACGGGGGSSGSSSSGGPPPVANQVAAVVDAGPPGVNTINTLYTTVQLCAPGSTSACQTIDHVQVDTGSYGFRVIASVLGQGLTLAQLPQVTSGNSALVECVQFLDGWSWGSVRTADLRIAGELASSVPIEVIGDPGFPDSLIPSTCANVPGGTVEDTVAQFGANAILGIGPYVQDCGGGCASGTQDGSFYNACTLSAPASCTPTTTSVQVSNPVAFFASDNDGVVLSLPAVADAGVASLSGTLTFGVATQADNALGGATLFKLDPSYGTLSTQFNGALLNVSVIDSGSNGLFFDDAAIPTCPASPGFYCPSSPLALSGVIQGVNGATRTISFNVDSLDTLAASVTASPTLAGTFGNSQGFDWGLPFFYGRTVFVVLETSTLGGVTGPALAF